MRIGICTIYAVCWNWIDWRSPDLDICYRALRIVRTFFTFIIID